MTRKEYKKMCQEEKAPSYKLMLLGIFFAIIGFIIVVLTILFIKIFTIQIMGFALGGVIAFVGVIIDFIGEVILIKKFKEYKKSLCN